MRIIENQTFDMERALYGSEGVLVKSCSFDGPADGESAFKECSDIAAENCFFNLRYPFWHDHGLKISGSEMTKLCRASLWYSDHIEITDTKMHGIKALRECSDVVIRDCDIISPEFGWSVRGIRMEDSTAVSEYFMMRSENLTFRGVTFRGKYSFQYIQNAVFEDCTFDTKDAGWADTKCVGLLFIFGMVIWIRLLPGEVQIPLTCMTTAVLRRLVKQGIRCRGTMSGLQRNQEM